MAIFHFEDSLHSHLRPIILLLLDSLMVNVVKQFLVGRIQPIE